MCGMSWAFLDSFPYLFVQGGYTAARSIHKTLKWRRMKLTAYHTQQNIHRYKKDLAWNNKYGAQSNWRLRSTTKL